MIKMAKPITVKEWQEIRVVVFERDGKKCAYCKRKERKIGLDHVIPLARGGSNDLSNLVVACSICNAKKGNRTPEEWKMGIKIKRPERPVKRFKFKKSPPKWQKSARKVVDKCGVRRLSVWCQISPAGVRGWIYGEGIPAKHMHRIFIMAPISGIDLTEKDFF